MKLQLQALLSNPHARYAAVAYIICKVGLQIFEVWFQSYDQKLRATAEIIEAAAVAYGLSAASAGNASLKEVGQDIQTQKEETKLRAAQTQLRTMREILPGD